MNDQKENLGKQEQTEPESEPSVKPGAPQRIGTIAHIGSRGGLNAALLLASLSVNAGLAQAGQMRDSQKVINGIAERESIHRDSFPDLDKIVKQQAKSSKVTYDKPHRHKGGHKANARKSKKR